MENIWQIQTNIDWSSFGAFKLHFDKRFFSRWENAAGAFCLALSQCGIVNLVFHVTESSDQSSDQLKPLSPPGDVSKNYRKENWMDFGETAQIYTKDKTLTNRNKLVRMKTSQWQIHPDISISQTSTNSSRWLSVWLQHNHCCLSDTETTWPTYDTHTRRRRWVYTQVGPAPALQLHVLFTGHSREQRPSTHTHTHTLPNTHSHTEWGNTHTSCVAAAQFKFSVNLLHTALPVRAEGQRAA